MPQSINIAKRGQYGTSSKIIDPHAGIDENQLSLLIASKSPRQPSLPRSRRIPACLLRRSRVLSPSSTASRLVFRPVARSVSRISLSSITMFVRMDVYPCRQLYTFQARAAGRDRVTRREGDERAVL